MFQAHGEDRRQTEEQRQPGTPQPKQEKKTEPKKQEPKQEEETPRRSAWWGNR
jgi:hypothetical protein